jgi:diguanylate cyclase (GGDEF)-like protein
MTVRQEDDTDDDVEDDGVGDDVAGDAGDGSGAGDITGAIPPDVAARLLQAFDRAPSVMITLLDADLKTRWVSESARWVMGVDPGSRVGRMPLDRVHPEDVERIVRGVQHLKAANAITPNVPVVEPARYRVRRPDGRWQVMEALVLNMLADPGVQGLVLVTRSADGHVQGADHILDLLVANAPLTEVLAGCATLVARYLGQGAIVGVVDGDAVVGAPPGSAAERLAADDRWWRDALDDGKVRTPDGFTGYPDDLAAAARAAGFRSVRVVPLLDTSTGEVMGCIVVWLLVALDDGQDISTNAGIHQASRLANLVLGEQRRHHALRQEALTDPLTGAGNRSALRRRLDGAAGEVTVALVDLDDFKPVNDTYGHDAGDAVLREVASRLIRLVREDDLVVRFGGDEFAVVFADGTPAEGVDSSTERMLQAIETPIPLGAAPTISVTASVGIATAAAGDVVRLADAALYRAKRARG